MAEKDDYLLEILTDLGFITTQQVEKYRAEATQASVGVVDLMLAEKVLRPADIAQAKAALSGAEVVTLADLKLSDEVIGLIRRDIAKKYRVIPIGKHGNTVTVALSDPSDLDTIDSLTHLLRAEIEIKVTSEEDIENALNKYYGSKVEKVQSSEMADAIQEFTESDVNVAKAKEDDATEVEADAPLIKLVNSLIVEAFKLRASDIHLEPMSRTFRIRYRIDGVLREMKSPPKRLQASILSRIKIQSNMSIAERRIPQDGRIQSKVGAKLIDLRVSCCRRTMAKAS